MAVSTHLGGLARSTSSDKLHAMAPGSSASAAPMRRTAKTPFQHPLQHAGHKPDVTASCGALSSSSGSSSSRGSLSAIRNLSLRRSLSLSGAFGEWSRPLPWLRVPDELWGAVNAVTAAVSPASPAGAPTRRDVSTQASASAAAAPPAPSPEHISDLRARLDWKPRLSNKQAALCVVFAMLVCCAAYAVRHPAAISFWFGASMAALFAAGVAASRALILEREYQKRLVSERELAGRHSRFRTLEGVDVHYILEQPSPVGRGSGGSIDASRGVSDGSSSGGNSNTAAVHCYHGFGANTFSWSFVQEALAGRHGVQVTAHDMPGFGLTQRVKHSNAYTLECNGRLGRAVLEAELASGGSSATSDGGRVLIGHSLGAACVAAEAIANPEGLSALVLVAPAIVALRLGRHEAQQEARAEEEAALQGDQLKAAHARASFAEFQQNTASTLMQSIGSIRNTLLRVAAALGYAITASATRLALAAISPLLVLALRASVRSRAFWERGLSRAWYRKAGVTEAVVDNYRLPQLIKGWEAGLIAFLRARVTAGRPFLERITAAYHGREAMTQVEKLLDAVTNHNIRVLIIHGENDALVPAANSRRLASILPHAQLHILPNCGHNPQEELPERFVQLVCDFLSSKHSGAAGSEPDWPPSSASNTSSGFPVDAPPAS